MMVTTVLNREQVVQLLTIECVKAGGQKMWAMQHHISPQYVCDVIHNRREPGLSILGQLGLQKVVMYTR